MSVAIYFKSSRGFGNNVFDLISAIYLKNKYQIPIYFAIDRSKDGTNKDPFFDYIFYQSQKRIEYISLKEYIDLKKKLSIVKIYLDTLDDLPKKIINNVQFVGLYNFAYIMYSSFNSEDKKLLEINSNLIYPLIYQKYIINFKKNYACIHIRYGDKLCFALDEFKQTKYAKYIMPIYTPQYYIDQINELLQQDLEEILVMTDSPEIVNKYIMDHFKDNPRIVLFDQNYVNIFYLMTYARYLVLSYSTFSFAAGYFNETATCYLLKNYTAYFKKRPIFSADTISPSWIIVDNKNYLLNFEQDLLRILMVDYGRCQKYINQKAGQEEKNKKIISENLDSLVTNGPLVIEKTKITIKLLVHGTVSFDNLAVMGTTKIYGTIIGKNGTFSTFSIYGSVNIDDCTIKKLLCTGPLFSEKITVHDSASIIGPVYISNSKIKIMELISDDITINNSSISVLTMHNSKDNGFKTAINGSTIDTLIIKGKKMLVNTDVGTKINKIINASVTILNE